jgi:cell division septation protein DedD
MRGVFDDKQLEPAPVKRDTELTLGSATLLAIFFGLVLLCGLCFGLGYAVGHRSTQPLPAANAQTATGVTPAESGNSSAKPSANSEAPQTPPPASADTEEQPPATPSGTAPTAVAETLPAPVQTGAASSEPQVHPALIPAAATAQPGQPAATAQPAGSLMVQIAAVSNQEDAEVLTSALRKRGYAVTVRRDPADNLIHVRIGPFATPAEANSWKMKLLNDGYNAIVQP